MKILLTGSSGYVGSALLPKLKQAGHHVTTCDVGWFSDAPVNLRDVRDIKDVSMYDAVIHLAAIANDPSVAFYPRRSWETSVLAMQQMCQSIQRAESKTKMIYASSVSVYGADRGMVDEEMNLYPLSDYNKTKMCAERVLLSYVTLPSRYVIIRPATICGVSPRMRLDLTVNMLVMQAMRKGLMTVHGGSQWRPSIHIDDMCDLYLWALQPDVYGIFNAGFENHCILDIAKIVKEYTKADIEVTAQRDARSYQVNSDFLLSRGFKPKKTIRHAIEELIPAIESGKIQDELRWNNLQWMNHLGVKDE